MDNSEYETQPSQEEHVLYITKNSPTERVAGLYEKYQKRYMYYFSRKFGDIRDVEDLCQDMFLRLLTSPAFPECHSEHGELAYLNTVARSVVIDYYRHFQQRKKYFTEESYSDISETETERKAENIYRSFEMSNNTRETLYEQVCQFPQEYQLLFSDFFVIGSSKQEISEHLHLSIPTINKRIKIIQNYLTKFFSDSANSNSFFDQSEMQVKRKKFKNVSDYLELEQIQTLFESLTSFQQTEFHYQYVIYSARISIYSNKVLIGFIEPNQKSLLITLALPKEYPLQESDALYTRQRSVKGRTQEVWTVVFNSTNETAKIYELLKETEQYLTGTEKKTRKYTRNHLRRK